MYIAIDTNVLSNDLRLRSKGVKAFIQYLRNTNSRLLLSDIVRIEIEANFKRQSRGALKDLDSALRNLNRLGIKDVLSLNTDIMFESALSTWRQDISSILSENIFEQIPIYSDLLEEVARRLAERIPPSSAKGEEYRDCVIWASLLRYAQNNPSHSPIALISNDGGFSDDKVCLRPELQAELTERNLLIQYYSSLENFLKDKNSEVPEEDVYSGGEMRLTGGSLIVQGLFGGPVFQFIGPGFTISNKGADQGNVGASRCSPCRAGERLSLNSTFAGELGLGSGPSSIKGKQYPHLYYSGIIDFYGETEIEESESPQVSVIGKFTLSGLMKGYENNPFIAYPGSSVFDVKLSGSGTATVELSRFPIASDEHHYSFRSITYRFEQ